MAFLRNRHPQVAARSAAFGLTALALGKAAAGAAAGSTALLVDGITTLASSIGPSSRWVLARRASARAEGTTPAKTHALSQRLAASLTLFLGLEGAVLSFRGLLAQEAANTSFALRFTGFAAALLFLLVHFAARLRNGHTSEELRRLLRQGIAPAVLALLGSASILFADPIGAGLAGRLDAAAGVGMSALLFRNGRRLVVGQAGASDTPEQSRRDVEELIKAAQEVRGVIMVDELVATEQGHYVTVTATVSVNPRITVMEGQEIARALSSHLLHEFHHLSDVLVIVHPYDRGYPYNNSSMGSEHPVFPPMLH
ncbi:cation transporter dimerization domain-containing protein [Gorillibacterium sp. CAU 1737]|uniref:cation transporter dimerization domain-containing protein n=1 Tax=Gorillibacterium sp. CAU 1737 TaxID=3140362 RepID=UPI003261452F